MTLNHAGIPLTPVVILLFGAFAIARLRAAPKVELLETADAR
jgi:hypothetical protein